MPKSRKWNDLQLIDAVKKSYSVRQVIKRLGLIPAGGNYIQIKNRIEYLKISTEHFLGKGWNIDAKNLRKNKIPLSHILVKNSTFQSHKLKKRLIKENIKRELCEICDWAKRSIDGRIPLELDHINGIRTDNRLSNLRILCPNCHSLQPTHRGKNIKK